MCLWKHILANRYHHLPLSESDRGKLLLHIRFWGRVKDRGVWEWEGLGDKGLKLEADYGGNVALVNF